MKQNKECEKGMTTTARSPVYVPNERGLRLTSRVADVDDEWDPAVVEDSLKRAGRKQ